MMIVWKICESLKVSLLEENIMPRANLPPLLVHLRERRPEKLHYIGVSFGLTRDLFRFWRKHNFVPFYLGHVPNAVTGEHTCMVLRSLNSDDIEAGNSSQLGFLEPFFQDFRRRFSRLLGTTFQTLDYKLAMSILASKKNFNDQEDASTMSNNLLLESLLTPFDMKRLEAYTNNSVDYHMILDLVPVLAYHYFQGEIPVSLSPVQASVLFCIGMQNHDVTHIKEEMKLQREQILSLFIKVMKKLYNYLYSVVTKEFDATLPRLREVTLAPLSVSVDEDLDEAAKEVKKNLTVDNEGSLNPELLQKYGIIDREGAFEKALPNASGKDPPSGLVSIKSSRKNMEIVAHKEDKRKRKEKMKGDKKSNKKVRK